MSSSSLLFLKRERKKRRTGEARFSISCTFIDKTNIIVEIEAIGGRIRNRLDSKNAIPKLI